MRLQLRNNEEIVAEAHFHWLTYLIPGLWASIGALPTLVMPFVWVLGEQKSDEPNMGTTFLFTLLIFWGPLVYQILRNKTKRYLVTNQRFYIEDGIISKNVSDIPLSKINDVGFRQGILQRFFNSCSLAVMTGNSKPTMIKNIANSKEFASALSDAASSQKGA